jgi:hypothetical protein
MNVLALQRNVQFLYEEHLARIELRSLGCEAYERSDDNAWEIHTHLNGNESLIHNRSAYIGEVDQRPTIYGQLLLPAYQGGRFNRTRSVNQYLTHWIYPYRGKFHPQMVRALLNILGAQPGCTVLDPFVGSGTTALETSLLGANCVGIDTSPVCILLTRVKTQAFEVVDQLSELVSEILTSGALFPCRGEASDKSDQRLLDFTEVARLVTASDVNRRGRESEVSFRKNLRAMLESVKAQSKAIREFGIRPGQVTAIRGDARDLTSAGIESSSVDIVVTSPPYSIALDYVKNDEHALLELGADLARLRQEMIGVRGKGARDRLERYNCDMQAVFGEVARVLKPEGRAAFVIGNATVDGKEVTTTDTMVDWAISAGLRLDRNIPKIVFGLYNVMVDERILVFSKPK